MCFFKTLMLFLNFWRISSISYFWILLSTLIHWWNVIDSLLLWKISIFNSRSEQSTHLYWINSVDWFDNQVCSSSFNAFSGRPSFSWSNFIRKSNLLANDLTISIRLFGPFGSAFTTFLRLRFLVDANVKDYEDVGFSLFCFLDFSR